MPFVCAEGLFCGYGGRNEGECGVPSSGLHRTRTQTAARPPEEEGEAARNNVVMSAGKRSCPDIICYLLSVILVPVRYERIIYHGSDVSDSAYLQRKC